MAGSSVASRNRFHRVERLAALQIRPEPIQGDRVRDVGEHYDRIHAACAEYFKSDYPASTMVEISSLVNPDMLIEIEAIAVV